MPKSAFADSHIRPLTAQRPAVGDVPGAAKAVEKLTVLFACAHRRESRDLSADFPVVPGISRNAECLELVADGQGRANQHVERRPVHFHVCAERAFRDFEEVGITTLKRDVFVQRITTKDTPGGSRAVQIDTVDVHIVDTGTGAEIKTVVLRFRLCSSTA